jgi:gliding motility-associated-like protein
MIIQMQGAELDVDPTPTVAWGGNYTVPYEWTSGAIPWGLQPWLWGTVTNYHNAGKYEMAEVTGVNGSGPNTIQLLCGLQNNYTASGKVQIIRVPRFNNLTINTGVNVEAQAWNGTTGGIVALEVNGNLVMNGTSKISATDKGFRGAVADNAGFGGVNTAHTNGTGNGSTAVGSAGTGEGGRKGEGIAGFTPEYNTNLYSPYGRGAAANGGGGGGFNNAGGGGGSNVGATSGYTGKGIPSTSFAASVWNLETAGFGGSSSPGGGRGGYTYSTSNQNELTVGPNNTAWNGDARKENGGFGGHPLAFDAARLFMGGGGGAGDQDNGQAGGGGNGGGIVFVTCYGSISGTGTIEANGSVGQNSNPLNQAVNFSNTVRGRDGAGGGGGGGFICIKNTSPIPASINLNARGGNGGNQVLTYLSAPATQEAGGPGGGGAGGGIMFTSGTPTQSITPGNAGTTNSNSVTNFNVNGATGGGLGVSGIASPVFDLTPNNASVCSGQSATISVNVIGTQPAGSTITWYTTEFGATSVHTGASWTIPNVTSSVTYWVGVCPGTFRIPVTITVGGPTISGTAVISNATCSAGGSITGLSASGGVPTLSYEWNGVSSASANLSNASAGSYTLVVTDGAGCTASSGPYTIGSTGGPTVTTTSMVVTQANCNNTNGAISGITATGTGLTYSWNSGAYTTLNLSNIPSGSYSLVVTDNNGCTANAGPIAVTQAAGPAINSTNVALIHTSCGNNNGSISGITASGTGLTYSWNSGAYSTLDITGLSAGNYSLVVTDNNGCTDAYGPVAINSSSVPAINSTAMTITDAHCSNADGAIDAIAVSGGSAPYTYSWNSGAYTTLNLSNIPSGSYSLVVTDNAGCTASAGPFAVADIAGPSINATNLVVANVTCTGNDGSITGITASGTGLTYSWNLGAYATLDITGLSAGNYALLVTDGFGCNAAYGPITIASSTPIVLNDGAVVITPTGCIGSTGAITGISFTGGTSPTISWSNGANTLDITNLAAGTYTLTVSDAFNCSATGSYVVTSASGLTINTAGAVVMNEMCGDNNGSITGLTVNGGTLPYTYEWNNSAALNTLNISDLDSGMYDLIVTDASGCVATTSLFVGFVDGPSINLSNAVIVNESCVGNNGSISGVVAVGNGPFTYAWQGSPLTTISITGLSAGSYILTVTDANGCAESSTPLTVNAVPGPIANFSLSSTVVSPGENVHFTDMSSGTVQTYSWSIGGVVLSNTDEADFASLVEGTYMMTLVIVSPEGCVDSISKPFAVLGDLVIPNILTANGDQVNDLFEIKNLKPNSELVIQNRWGNMVYHTKNYKNDWDGKDTSGQLLSDGVYFYQLITADGKTMQGFVHLLIK